MKDQQKLTMFLCILFTFPDMCRVCVVVLLAITISYIAYWVRSRHKLERRLSREAEHAAAASRRSVSASSNSLGSSNRPSQSVNKPPTKYAAAAVASVPMPNNVAGCHGPSRESLLAAQAALTLFGPPPGPLSTITTSNATSELEDDDSEEESAFDDYLDRLSNPAHMSDSSAPTDALRSGRSPPRVIGTVYESLARLAMVPTVASDSSSQPRPVER